MGYIYIQVCLTVGYMTERRNIKIPEDVFNEHNERREELGLTWAQYIDREAPQANGLTEEDIRRITREEVREALMELKA